MTVYYTREKAKFGGTTGTIIPFTTRLPDTNTPDLGDWRPLLPAGYLRCDGSILSADQYPVLAEVIGVGDNCPFAKEPLANENTFQLPDLGSKYVRASLSAGEYFFDNVVRNDDGLKKVGSEVFIELLKGDVITIDYEGFFRIQPTSTIEFSGNPLYIAENDAETLPAILSDTNFQAHGHTADVGVFGYTGNWTDTSFNSNDGQSGGDNDGKPEGENILEFVPNAEGGTVTPSHTHRINVPKGSDLGKPENFDFEFNFSETEYPPVGLSSSVNLTAENIQKLDNAISPYLIMEYLIKI